jgi:hypothetical protein
VEKTTHILKDGTLLLMLDLAGSAQGLARQINCLAVHPSRPHLCVTGASSGTLAVWDLRMTSAPAVQSPVRPGAGEVLEVSRHSCHDYIRRTKPDGILEPESLLSGPQCAQPCMCLA